jgi:hypothetical protein
MISTGSASPTKCDVRTGNPTSRTCCSRPNCSGDSTRSDPLCWRPLRTRICCDQLQARSQRPFQDLILAIANRLIAQDADGGALPTLYAAVADIPGNSFAGPRGFLEQRGTSRLSAAPGPPQDLDVARRRWRSPRNRPASTFRSSHAPSTHPTLVSACRMNQAESFFISVSKNQRKERMMIATN